MSTTVSEPAFGGGSGGGDASIKSKIINLVTSVRTLMRSTFYHYISFLLPHWLLAPDSCASQRRLVAYRTMCWQKSTVPLIGINMFIIIYELALGWTDRQQLAMGDDRSYELKPRQWERRGRQEQASMKNEVAQSMYNRGEGWAVTTINLGYGWAKVRKGVRQVSGLAFRERG